MNFNHSDRVLEILDKLNHFMGEYIYPAEKIFKKQIDRDKDKVPQIIEDLKLKAKKQGLWNLFLPDEKLGYGLSNVEYAPLCEVMGRSLIKGNIKKYLNRS